MGHGNLAKEKVINLLIINIDLLNLQLAIKRKDAFCILSGENYGKAN